MGSISRLCLRAVILALTQSSLDAAEPADSLTISEAMFSPVSGPNEFVEIWNGGSAPVNLTGWRLRDNVETDTIVGPDLILLPGRFAVIFENDYDTLAGVYDGLIPFEALVLRVTDGSIGNGLNNSGDAIRLISAAGDTVSIYSYVSSNPTGISDEKIILNGDQSSSNWTNSLSLHGTPGARNSVSPAEYDLAITGMQFDPEHPSISDTVRAATFVRNAGLSPVSSFLIRISEDVNTNGRSDPGEGTDSVALSLAFPPGDSLRVELTVGVLSVGRHVMLAEVVGVIPSDEDLSDNSFVDSVDINASAVSDSITFSEIMFDPAGSEASDEFIELYNFGSVPVDLSNWLIGDSLGSDAIIDAGYGTVLQDGSYGIVFDASYDIANGVYANRIPPSSLIVQIDGATFGGSSSGLTNSMSRRMALLTSTGDTVCSHRYTAGNDEDFSDEKVDLAGPNQSGNWRDGLFPGGTPGYLNSVSPVDLDIAIDSADITTDPQAPERGMAFDLRATIRSLGRLTIPSPVVARAYEDINFDNDPNVGELLDSLVTPGVSDSMTVTFHHPGGFTDGVKRVLVQVDCDGDERLNNNRTARTVFFRQPWNMVVINELMYDVSSGGVEFVEVFNRGAAHVQLTNWAIRDAGSLKTIPMENAWLPSGGFRVLAGDSAILDHGIPDSVVIIVPGMPSLNNDADDMVLLDETGAVVDSVHYFNSWGGRSGVSLERVHPDGGSQNPGNWVSCVASGGHTGGRTNSALTARPFDARSVVINEVMYSPFSGEQEYVEIYNRSDSTVDLGGWGLSVGVGKALLSIGPLPLAPGCYRVVSDARDLGGRFDLPDSLHIQPVDPLPALSNTGATLVLHDPVGSAIDSLTYTSAWGGGPGLSLERKSPAGLSTLHSNWTSCVFPEGGTPGEVNSVLAGELPRKIRIHVDPNPFFPERNEEALIVTDLPVSQARITIRIYDTQGRLIATLLNNSPSGTHRETRWDGKDRQGRPARMGIYVVYVEAIEEVSGFNGQKKATVVLGKKL